MLGTVMHGRGRLYGKRADPGLPVIFPRKSWPLKKVACVCYFEYFKQYRKCEWLWNRNSPSWSSILSHSSKMKCLRCFRSSALLRTRAAIRPGVPTTMCGQFVLSICSSFVINIPPKKTAIFTPFIYLLKRSYSLLIWNASSRVWHITRTETWILKKKN